MAASSVVSSSASPLPRHPIPPHRRDSAVSVATVPSSHPITTATNGDIVTPSNSLITTATRPSFDATTTKSSSAERLQSQLFTRPAGPSTTPSAQTLPGLYEVLYGTGWAVLTQPFASQYAEEAKRNVEKARQKQQEELDRRKMMEAHQYPGGKPILLPPDKKPDDIDVEFLYTDSSKEESGAQGASSSSYDPSNSSLGSTETSDTGKKQKARLAKFIRRVRKVTHLLTGDPGPTSHVAATPETADTRSLSTSDTVTAHASKRPGPLERFAMWLVSWKTDESEIALADSPPNCTFLQTGADAGRGMP
ncbi:hypothetical protein NliqN6_3306 [Naganishia liquefaciens]|uniref:Uncharacterized protein n=1 Tax=Naganishia liquefaciens TaxID=104408 RepID=A0A8H3YEV6_9TREE|nr:hypothetical protein NliqN6_3306 [Naganishia liquefaciens]